MGRSDSELSLLLTGDAEIRKLNLAYRGKDRPTDVLSFPAAPLPAGRAVSGRSRPGSLGDVVISVPTADAQARGLGVTLLQECSRLLVHGILHLVGFDHEGSKEDAARMRRMEDRLLAGGETD